MTLKVIDRTYVATLVIECPNRCEGKGCQHHGSGHEWRTSATLPQGTSVDYARTLLERHAEQYPKSGPYRLVEHVIESKTTVEVLETLEVQETDPYYCPDCHHPWGYHHSDLACSMPLSASGLPVSHTEETVRRCACKRIPPTN